MKIVSHYQVLNDDSLKIRYDHEIKYRLTPRYDLTIEA